MPRLGRLDRAIPKARFFPVNHSPYSVWKTLGTFGTLRAARYRLAPPRSSLTGEALMLIEGRRSIEIGGPSATFLATGVLPIYPAMRTIDNVNFASETLWEGALEDGAPYLPMGSPTGVQLLREATDLRDIPDEAYDVVLSSHVLEHIANPLRALREWRRVCRESGILCLIVPHRDGSFDRRRPVTSIDHLRGDAVAEVDEGDDTHFEEVIRLHDLHRDRPAGSLGDFKARVADNRRVRSVHHHVFDVNITLAAIIETGWMPIAAEARRPFHIIVLAQKSSNLPTDFDPRSIVRGSPFRSDRASALGAR